MAFSLKHGNDSVALFSCMFCFIFVLFYIHFAVVNAKCALCHSDPHFDLEKEECDVLEKVNQIY